MRIGIIDSGVGGLTVLMALRQRVPASYIYMMDNKYLPYGEKTEAFIQQRLAQLSAYLIECGAELIVIACNTATTQAVEFLRGKFTIPFVGVVPAIKPAALLSQGKGFAVLATPATVNGVYLQDLIQTFAANDEKVLTFGSSELVRLAEEKIWYQHDVSAQVADILSVSCLASTPPAILVLGCTHFPFLADEIRQAFAGEVLLLETSEAIARRVEVLSAENSDVVSEVQENRFISTRELLPAQVERLKEFGFDQHSCWPKPLVS